MKYSVFLTPEESSYRYFGEVIRDLARRHSGPFFQPHVTIYGGRTDDIDTVTEVMAGIAAEISPFELEVAGVMATDAYFKSVFVTFRSDPAPVRIHELVKHRLREDSGYQLFPHLSLAYLDLPLAEKEEIASGVELALTRVPFSELRVVFPDDEEAGWAGTDRWRVAGRWPLSG